MQKPRVAEGASLAAAAADHVPLDCDCVSRAPPPLARARDVAGAAFVFPPLPPCTAAAASSGDVVPAAPSPSTSIAGSCKSIGLGLSSARSTAAPLRVIKVLYLYAGPPREQGLHAALDKAAQVLKVLNVRFEVNEMDLCRDGLLHDFMMPEVADKIKKDIAGGEYFLIVTTPPCSSFSRLTHSNKRGPGPVRDANHVYGFPWNKGKAFATAEAGNFHVRLTVEALLAAASAGVLAIMQNPEDLGQAALGDPASMWQLWEVRALEEKGYCRGATFRCNHEDLHYRKPTGLYANFDLGEKVFPGWPEFRSGIAFQKKTSRVYAGPLPRECGCGFPLVPHVSLERKASDGKFLSTGTARWPQGLCDYVAAQALKAWRKTGTAPPQSMPTAVAQITMDTTQPTCSRGRQIHSDAA